MRNILIVLLTLASVFANAQTPEKFNASKLTAKQQADLKKFREMKGDRYKQFMKIKSIIPQGKITQKDGLTIGIDEKTVPVIMTKEQLISLFGKPDNEQNSVLDYNIGIQRCEANIFLTADKKNVMGYAFSQCSQYQK